MARIRIKTLSQLVKDLDTVFSIYIRIRDMKGGGYSLCVTCSKPMTFKTSQCGHFVSRRHKATRWDEANCAAQCYACNMHNQGRQYEFGLAIDKRFGVGTAQQLMMRSHNSFSPDRSKIQLMIEHYKRKTVEL